MTNAEKLLDALTFLPDDLLEETDALRRKKRSHWKQWAALAACVCLAAGLLLLMPGAQSADNGSGIGWIDPESGHDGAEDQQSAGSTVCVRATVDEIYEDKLIVTLSPDSDPRQVTVLPDAMADIPDLSPGQAIRIFLKDPAQTQEDTLTPYKIEIEEES